MYPKHNNKKFFKKNSFQNVVYLHTGVLLSHLEELNYVICWKMDGTGAHNMK
jgi:hypothetical protein